MTDEEIRAQLAAGAGLPEAALRAAVLRPEPILDAVIALADKVRRGVVLLPPEENLAFFGLHALAAARATAAFPALMTLLTCDEFQRQRIWG
jgi:hypothetical protein